MRFQRASSQGTVPIYRKWSKVIEPLVNFSPATQLTSPLEFAYHLEQIVISGAEVRLNLPLTLSGTYDNVIKTVFESDKQKVGRATFTPTMAKSTFEAEVDKIQRLILQRQHWSQPRLQERNPDFRPFLEDYSFNGNNPSWLPFVFIKEKSSETSTTQIITSLMSRDEFRKIANIDVHQISQAFVFSGAHAASIIRFFLVPGDNHLTIAYKMDSYLPYINKKRMPRSQCVIDFEKEHSFGFVKIMHENKSFYSQTHHLIRLFEAARRIKVQRIVTDWILDPFHRYYLIRIKEFICTQVVKCPKPLIPLNQVFSLITCAVCQQKFTPKQINKFVTYKIIWQFFQHLKKRFVELSFQSLLKKSSQSAHVCDVCYNLVVAEAQLMEVEQKMAKATHTLFQDDPRQNTQLRVIHEGSKSQQPRMMTVWRFFLYVENLRDVELPQNDEKRGFFLHLKIHGQITSFRLPQSSITSKTIPVKGIKIHYFFSPADHIERFVIKTEIVARITHGAHWSNVVNEGESCGLFDETEKISMRKFKQILLFNERSQYCVMELHLGLQKDRLINTQDMNLRRVEDVYFPLEDYTACTILPAEWMETIDSSYCVERVKEHLQSTKHSLSLQQRSKKVKNVGLPSIKTNSKKLVL